MRGTDCARSAANLSTDGDQIYYGNEPAAELANESTDELYCRLWTDYIARPDVHPFFRQALSLTEKRVNQIAAEIYTRIDTLTGKYAELDILTA